MLAKLHIESLSNKLTKRDLRNAIETLPTELNPTYAEVIKRIWSQNEDEIELARCVLIWVSHAKRPLHTIELQHALAVRKDTTVIDEEALVDLDIIMSVCAGLVAVDIKSKVVRLVHYTTQSYLESIQTLHFSDAKILIASSCLRYLLLVEDFSDLESSDDNEVFDFWDGELQHFCGKRFVSEYPLFSYVVEHWADHARGDTEIALQNLILELFEQDSKVELVVNARKCLLIRAMTDYRENPSPIPRMCVAGLFGLKGVLMSIMEKGDDVTTTDSCGRSSLHYAAGEGHEETVRLLLDKGATFDLPDSDGMTPLQHAACRGYEGVVQLLLEKGAKTDLQNKIGWTALHYAASEGHEVVVGLLLKKRIVTALPEKNEETALYMAVNWRHDRVVFLLLENKADIYIRNINGETPLDLAEEGGHDDVIQLFEEISPTEKEQRV